MIKKVLRKKKKAADKLPARITNDTVAEYREKVLAGGRKLKYPLQYTRHKLVRNAILISLAGLVTLSVAVWVQLYVIKDTSDLAYRITRVIPLPVARIDGEFVPYSDYLLYHRSTENFLESQDGISEDAFDSKRVNFLKNDALNNAVRDAYVRKLAREANISISDDQVAEVITKQRTDRGLSEEAYIAVISDGLSWTIDEARQKLRHSLLRREVAYSVDTNAANIAQEVNSSLLAGSSLEEVANDLGNKVEYNPEVIVPKDNSDGGLSDAAAKLDIGATSGSIKTTTGDGYYFVTRQESREDEVRYSRIKIPLTVFKDNFENIKNSNKTSYYITIEE